MSEEKLQFRSMIRRWLPPWFLRPFGNAEKLFYTLGLIADGIVQWATEGTLGRLPGAGTPTALPYIGRDRRIRRGFAESDESYSARLVQWKDDWSIAGAAYSVLHQLRGFVTPHAPVMRYVHRQNGPWVSFLTINADATTAYQLNGTGNWTWDDQHATAPRRFWLVIYPPSGLWQKQAKWGATGLKWGQSGKTWGTTATRNQIASLKQIVREWSWPGSQCLYVCVTFNATNFEPTDTAPPNPDGNWKHYSKLNGSRQVRARLADTAYWRIH